MVAVSAVAAELPEVFVSYSHRDEGLKDDFLPHVRMLEPLSLLRQWHDRDIGLGDVWFEEIVRRLDTCAVAILLISANFLSSQFCTRTEVPPLLERRRRDGMMLAPILIRPCNWKRVPWLAALQMYPRDGVAISALQQWQQDAVFAEVNEEICKYLETGDPKALTPKHTAWPEPEAVDITRLPTSGYELIGRDDELNLLSDTWEQGRINVLSLVAWGGVGKSTLVNKWCEYLSADNYRGARRVFAWSFYSQGTNERVTSADQFIAEALTFFGDEDPTAGSAWAKGERLADLVRREKALLILDGLEPLQDRWQGIKDPSVQRLVEDLARDNAGLCVITTREPVKELADFPDTTLAQNLEQISAEAGRALLRILSVRGTDTELEQATRDFGNHALAINLLANWLRGAEGHHIRHAGEIPDLHMPDDRGRHPRRVMDAFARRFGEGPAMELLGLLGLFDRPASGDCINALRSPPAIPGLSEHLTQLSDADWLRLLDQLRDLGLVAPESNHTPEEIDAHPLVREHFGERLREEKPKGWRAGHERLYEHLRDSAEPLPDTLPEMEPLFQAMHHGCHAGRYREALHEIYLARLARYNEAYVIKKLGAFGADLAALAGLFDPPWDRPIATLIEREQGFVLGEAAFRLFALGWLREAVAPMQAGLERAVAQEDWTNAAIRAGNLSELHLTLGDVRKSVARGEAIVGYADRSGHAFQRITKRTTWALALHQAGAATRALALFEEAEALQAEWQPQFPWLYSFQGYEYSDLLLTQGRAEAVYERAMHSLAWVTTQNWLLAIALDHLSLGRATQVLGQLVETRTNLNQAVDGLRRAGRVDQIPRGLLARAALSREMGDLQSARRDLDEAMRMAIRGEMRLFQCDAHLECARLALAQSDPENARAYTASARDLIEKTGYGRRRPEVAELEAKLR